MLLQNSTNLDSQQLFELLLFAETHGILNIRDVEDTMNKIKLEKILKNHPYSITYSNGRFQTYVKDLTKKDGRRKIVKATQEQLNKELYDYYLAEEIKNGKVLETLESLYPEWLQYKSLHTTAPTYIQRVHCDWKKYYLGTDIIKVPLKNLDKLQLDEWAHNLIQEYHMTKNCYYSVTVIMRQVLFYAVDKGIIESNPFSLVKIDGRRLFQKSKKADNHTQVYQRDELQQLFNLAWNDFYNNDRLVYRLAPLAVLFQFQTGLRIGEVCCIKHTDVDGDYILINKMYRPLTKEVVDHTKGYEDRKVLLTETAKNIIRIAKEYQMQNHLDSNGYIFSCDGKPVLPRVINSRYAYYCEKIGTTHKSSHKSRKTYISSLIDGGVNINTIRELVGHADERTTYKSYCFDRNTEIERKRLIETSLS